MIARAKGRRIEVETGEELERRLRAEERASAFRRGFWQAAGFTGWFLAAGFVLLIVCLFLGAVDVLVKGW